MKSAASSVACWLALCGVVAPAPARAAQGLDPVELIRSIRQLKKARAQHSRVIHLEDESSGRGASLYLGKGGADGYPLYLILSRNNKKLHCHSLSLLAPGSGGEVRISLTPRPAERGGPPSSEELVAAFLPRADLERLLAGQSFRVVAGGWGETFRASVDDKGLEKLRRFRDKS